MIIISKNPKGRVYRRLIDVAFEHCDMFELVLLDDSTKEHYKHVFEPLESSYIESKIQSEWASNRLIEDTATVCYFRTTEEAKRVLKKKASSLFAWGTSTSLPEDLSFYKNGKVWMAVSGHEKEAVLDLESADETLQVLNTKGLKWEYIETEERD